jgi:hypothetical protein
MKPSPPHPESSPTPRQLRPTWRFGLEKPENRRIVTILQILTSNSSSLVLRPKAGLLDNLRRFQHHLNRITPPTNGNPTCRAAFLMRRRRRRPPSVPPPHELTTRRGTCPMPMAPEERASSLSEIGTVMCGYTCTYVSVSRRGDPVLAHHVPHDVIKDAPHRLLTQVVLLTTASSRVEPRTLGRKRQAIHIKQLIPNVLQKKKGKKMMIPESQKSETKKRGTSNSLICEMTGPGRSMIRPWL